VKYYRAESVHYIGGRAQVVFREFDIAKETDKTILLREVSVWARYSLPPYKRIVKGAFNQWASKSKEDAIKSMIHRKNRAIAIYKGRVTQSVNAIVEAERLLQRLNTEVQA
jgi:hypothetical protein